MTENNAENKAAYMACYWGQFIGIEIEKTEDYKHVLLGDAITRTDYIELTQLSDISDEHAIEVAIARGFVNVSRVKFVFDGYWVTIKIKGKRSVTKFVFYRDMSQPEIDKLRKLGYLVAWRDLSVEELINRGWAKVKEKQ